MTRPRVLDLFCGAGGAATGWHHAGFDVVGVDTVDQPHYPFEFRQDDALAVLASDADFVRNFDAIHASPPCQHYSILAKRNRNAHVWPDLIGPVRELLKASGLPWVIENVEGAPLVDPLTLCGTMFEGLRVIRHRMFEASFPLAIPCPPLTHPRHPLVFTYDKRKSHYGKLDQDTAFVSVNGGGNCTVANARDAMGIDWPMTKAEVNEAIPPAYTEHVGRELLKATHA